MHCLHFLWNLKIFSPFKKFDGRINVELIWLINTWFPLCLKPWGDYQAFSFPGFIVFTAMLYDSAAAAAAKSLQSCPTLCDPIDGSPPGSPLPGILQARTLEWVAMSFSNAWKWKVKVKSLSRVRLLATPWTAAHQTPPSMGFSRREYWSGVLRYSQDSRRNPKYTHAVL